MCVVIFNHLHTCPHVFRQSVDAHSFMCQYHCCVVVLQAL
jgi:hypothetical protein